MYTKTKFAHFWAEYKNDIVSALCALMITVLVRSGYTDLNAYLRDRLPGSPSSQTHTTQSAKPQTDNEKRAHALYLQKLFLEAISFRKSQNQSSTSELHKGPVVSDRTVVAEANSTEVIQPSTPFDTFPPFIRTVQPVTGTPNWGEMSTPAQWNRRYDEMSARDFVPVPGYDLVKLVVPLKTLISPRNVEEITRKLYYSTRYYGAYDIDKGEFTGTHAGVDLKLALGQPIVAIAGGRVQSIIFDDSLGQHIVIEHRSSVDGIFYSIYAHLGTVTVQEGQDVTPGQIIGTVGMTGSTSGPHLHLQVDIGRGEAKHIPYFTSVIPSPAEAATHTVNPIRFIERYSDGE